MLSKAVIGRSRNISAFTNLVTGLLYDRITNEFGCLNANSESNNGECPAKPKTITVGFLCSEFRIRLWASAAGPRDGVVMVLGLVPVNQPLLKISQDDLLAGW